MATLVPFVITNDGTANVTVNPANNANGVAEWVSSGSRSQAYKATASVKNSGTATRRYTFKLQIPKLDTQTVNGVNLPVTAWVGYVNVDVQIPVYASDADRAVIAKSLLNSFSVTSPFYLSMLNDQGFW